MNVRQALARATQPWDATYRDAAPPPDRRDAAVLLAYVLGRDRPWLLAHPDVELSPGEEAAYLQTLADRRARKPLQYITGHQEFYGLDLQLSSATLIPRPETEILVQAVLQWADTQRPLSAKPLRLVDVGTGSGAIALAVAANLSHGIVEALDVSPAVRPIVEANARRHGLSDRVRFAESDLLAALQPQLAVGFRFDAVLSNPPYIPAGDAPTLQPEVREYEPHTALFAGAEGLDLYRRLIPQARAALRPGGLLAMEFGFGQRQALQQLLGGWTQLQFLDDLAGISRVVLALRPSP